MSVSEEIKSISELSQNQGEAVALNLNTSTENPSEFATLPVKVESAEVSLNDVTVPTTPNSVDSSRKSNLRGRWRRTTASSSSLKEEKESQRVGEVVAIAEVAAEPVKETVVKIGFSVSPESPKASAPMAKEEDKIAEAKVEGQGTEEYTSLAQEKPAQRSRTREERGDRYQGNDRRFNRSGADRERSKTPLASSYASMKDTAAKQWNEEDLVKRVSLWQKIKRLFSFCFPSNKSACVADKNPSDRRNGSHYSGHHRRHRYYKNDRNNRGRTRPHQS